FPRVGLVAVVVAIVLVAAVAPFAAASTQGPLAPSAAVDDAGTGSVVWTNPADAESSDGVYAFAGVASTTTHYLKLTNFGFSIPAGSTITGVTVAVERIKTGSSQDVRDASVKLVKASA